MILYVRLFYNSLIIIYFGSCVPTLIGRYTENIEDFSLILPYKLNYDYKFQSYYTKQHFNHEPLKRQTRSLNDPEMLRYGLRLNNKEYHIELWPNHRLVTPHTIIEKRDPIIRVQDRDLKQINRSELCYYTGRLRDYPLSKVAISTCDGLAGYVNLEGERYFIEPLKDHVPNHIGQHLHVIYKKSAKLAKRGCGTKDDWITAWTERLFNEYLDGNLLNVTRRGTESVQRYLETLVVCDKKFLDHHKNTDYEKYVLTIMNMVADFYHDNSVGNQLDVVVVRIIYLHKEEDEIDLVLNRDADKSLESFCKWQEKINPKELSNPNHHDIAILLTRYDICGDNLEDCGLMGLAYVATACTKNQPCSINEDSGLLLAIVVAHEMGHIMGCSHDSKEESKCESQDEDQSFFVMAPYVHMFTTRWSKCSRGFITSFFENNLGECLNDEPDTSMYEFTNMLPGAIYDGNEQCELAYPNSKVCILNKEEFCQTLFCKISPTECIGGIEPPADGTKCGPNMWCYRKKCIEIGQRPDAINGGWGSWGPYSDCSRTCGGGVRISERVCDNPKPEHKGRYCIGERKMIKTCNTEPCPMGKPSFRQVQCTQHNDKEFGGKLHKWKAFFQKDEPCALYCINEENIYAKLETNVEDGTPCYASTYDMCINGVCRSIGCDGEIDSKAVEDVCGVCNGDGTSCKIIEDKFIDNLRIGYYNVITIPTGSRNILIEEESPSINTLAISDKNQKIFFLNGDYKEQLDGIINIDGIEGIYTHPEPEREKLFIKGPLSQDILFLIAVYERKNVGYYYKYSEPLPYSTYIPHYHWEQLDWTQCSAKCDGGVQTSKISCVEEKAGKVSDTFCKNLKLPDISTQKCNEKRCKTRWRIGKWGRCHACKFQSGLRMRSVECVKESPHFGAEEILVEDDECTEPKPGIKQLCNSHKTCKRNRNTYNDLPNEMMTDVWQQIVANKGTANCNDVKRFCTTHNRPRVKSEKGVIVKDVLPKNEIKLIEVPIKESQMVSNLSDSEFETMGDEVSAVLDNTKARIIVGKKTSEELQRLEHTVQKKRHAKWKRS